MSKLFDCIKALSKESIKNHYWKNPPTASPDTPIEEIIRLIVSGKFRTIIIVADKKPVGIITDSDILDFIKPVYSSSFERSYFRLLRQSAEEYMVKNPVTIKENQTIQKALEIMEKFNIKRLVVIGEEGELMGLVTIRKIISDALNIDLMI